jgi:hypothetical protein
MKSLNSVRIALACLLAYPCLVRKASAVPPTAGSEDSAALAQAVIKQVDALATAERLRPTRYRVIQKMHFTDLAISDREVSSLVDQIGKNRRTEIKITYFDKKQWPTRMRESYLLETSTLEAFWYDTSASNIMGWDHPEDTPRSVHAENSIAGNSCYDPVLCIYGDSARSIAELASAMPHWKWECRRVKSTQGKDGSCFELIGGDSNASVTFLLDPARALCVVSYTFTFRGMPAGGTTIELQQISADRWFPKIVDGRVIAHGQESSRYIGTFSEVEASPGFSPSRFTINSFPLRDGLYWGTVHPDGSTSGKQYKDGRWFDTDALIQLEAARIKAIGTSSSPIKPTNRPASLPQTSSQSLPGVGWIMAGSGFVAAGCALGITAVLAGYRYILARKR